MKARQADIIRDLSCDSRNLLQNHFDLYALEHDTTNKCAVIELGVYANQVLVQFSLAETNLTYGCGGIVNCWRPQAAFFTVNDPASKR